MMRLSALGSGLPIRDMFCLGAARAILSYLGDTRKCFGSKIGPRHGQLLTSSHRHANTRIYSHRRPEVTRGTRVETQRLSGSRESQG